jgi:hypothetical protein
MNPDDLFDLLKRAAAGENIDEVFADGLEMLCTCSND